MNTKQILKKCGLLTGLMLMSFLSLAQQDRYVTRIIESPLEDVNIGANTVVVQGRSYKYRLDAGKSQAYLDEDIAKALKIRDLKVGVTYFFEMYSEKDVPELSDFKQIILVAKEKPAE
jgi:hypothetical protein